MVFPYRARWSQWKRKQKTKKNSIFKKSVSYLNIEIWDVFKKSMENEAVFTKTEMNIKWNVNFRQNNLLASNTLIRASFPLVEVPLKSFFDRVESSAIFLKNVLHEFKSCPGENFLFKKQENVAQIWLEWV